MAVPPIETTEPVSKFVPEIVTVAPPNVLPLFGEIEVTVTAFVATGDGVDGPPHDATTTATHTDIQG